MIDSISITNVATYGANSEKLKDLSKFNFLYGSNGTGKTTISRIIANEANYPSCQVQWGNGIKLESMVYNHDFVERNFNQSTELKGVFTLGEQQVDTLAKITSIKTELDGMSDKKTRLIQTLQGADGTSGKQAELEELESNLKSKCWAQKQKYDAKFQGAFEGYRGSSEKFKSKVLEEYKSNSTSLLSLQELEKKATNIFGPTPSTEYAVPSLDSPKILKHETNPILAKRVIGKEDVDIAGMIKKLGNSDWVREGRSFYDVNEGTCPFCQQSTNETFAKSLNEYFDETFLTDIQAISDLETNYLADASRLQQLLSSIIGSSSKFLDIEKLIAEKKLLDSRLAINRQRLTEKKKEPSRVIELESLGSIIVSIQALIASANVLIIEHNQMVENLSNERRTLTKQIWKYIIEELKADLQAYKQSSDSLDKAIAGVNSQIKKVTEETKQKEVELRKLEKLTTSVQPTIDGINALLSSFGFQGFKLDKVVSGNSYKLIRADGTDAKNTLSEGEKTFVTFLYFYHLLKGSNSDNGMTTDRIVVFDDPVSSLDSDILFIVSSLIKGLFDEVRLETGHIKQIFVLTHNVYFHKEVTFNPKRCGVAMNEESFWVVRKSEIGTTLEKHTSNPISTSYDLLWSEVRRSDRSTLTIQNTLRRILENYFKILGGVDPDSICDMFEGKEKLISKSLFSWVNDGSHFANDDLYVSIDSVQIDSYLKVFKSIFEKSGHIAHYEMMMGDTLIEASNSSLAI